MTQFVLAVVVLIIFVLYEAYNGKKREKELAQKLDAANQRYGALEETYKIVLNCLEESRSDQDKIQQRFDQLQHQKISADVKLGQKSENLLPFLSTFPYRDDEIRGLFNPIDLIVFRDDEVVFVEIKNGQSQLSEKQRKIRDNIKAGKVRFEVHRMDENGVKVK